MTDTFRIEDENRAPAEAKRQPWTPPTVETLDIAESESFYGSTGDDGIYNVS